MEALTAGCEARGQQQTTYGCGTADNHGDHHGDHDRQWAAALGRRNRPAGGAGKTKLPRVVCAEKRDGGRWTVRLQRCRQRVLRVVPSRSGRDPMVERNGANKPANPSPHSLISLQQPGTASSFLISNDVRPGDRTRNANAQGGMQKVLPVRYRVLCT